jgi:hypothetical protein
MRCRGFTTLNASFTGWAAMWELENWKDFSKMLENFAEAGLALVGIYALVSWLAVQRKQPPSDD